MAYNTKALLRDSGGFVLPQQYYDVGTDSYKPYGIALHTFQDAKDVIGNGVAFEVGVYKTLMVEIYGTSASRTVTFYAKGQSGALRVLSGVNLNGLAVANSTAGTDELWQFDISGLDAVIMDLTVVAGGNVTVKGKAIS